MNRAIVFALVVIAAGLGTADASSSLKLVGANVADARAALKMAVEARVDAQFERMFVSAEETGDLLQLIEETTTTMLPGSEVAFSGYADRWSFSAKIEKDRKGRGEVKMKGFGFTDQKQILDLVSSLSGRGVTEISVEGRIGVRAVRLKLEQNGWSPESKRHHTTLYERTWRTLSDPWISPEPAR
jgi:hypothetical protein